MPSSKGKLDVFIESILAESQREVDQMNRDMEDRRNTVLIQAETDLATQARAYRSEKISAIAARERRRVSARMSENKHALLEYREQCAQEMYDLVLQHIAEFTASSDYPDHLAKLLNQAIAQLGYGFSAMVYLRPEDMHLSDHLLQTVKGVSLGFQEGRFLLGGLQLVCPSMGRRVDMSFDSALTDITGHFSEVADMYVD